VVGRRRALTSLLFNGFAVNLYVFVVYMIIRHLLFLSEQVLGNSMEAVSYEES